MDFSGLIQKSHPKSNDNNYKQQQQQTGQKENLISRVVTLCFNKMVFYNKKYQACKEKESITITRRGEHSMETKTEDIGLTRQILHYLFKIHLRTKQSIA